tara:strand:- start:185 stop:367 length:183 start_codon:yes stop_codon:yes gene_type:complete
VVNWTEEELKEFEKMRREYREMYRTHALSKKLGLSFEDYLMMSLNYLRDEYADLKEQVEE